MVFPIKTITAVILFGTAALSIVILIIAIIVTLFD